MFGGNVVENPEQQLLEEIANKKLTRDDIVVRVEVGQVVTRVSPHLISVGAVA